MREYIIPHNYRNNGRILNLFDREQVKKTLVCIVPVAVVIHFIPCSLTIKAFFSVLLMGAPAAIFLFELDQVMIDMISFSKRKAVYSDGGEDYAYIKFKKQAGEGKTGQ